MKRKNFIVAAVLISSHLFSQEQPDSLPSPNSAFSFLDLSPVIITANKYEQRQAATGKVLHVISREQLDQNPGKTLSEILNTVTGININGANNTLGTNQTVNIRGASAGNALILIDGTPVNDPSLITNYFDLNLINTEQVERIEILKGGQSTLYGSDAVAGVINIIMRKAGKKQSLDIHSTAGSYGTFNNSIVAAGFNRKASWSLGYTHITSRGFSAAYDSTGNKGFDKDGFNQNGLSARLQWAISKKLTAKWNGIYSRYRTDVDAGAFRDDKDFNSGSKNIQTGTGLSYQYKQGRLHLNYQYNAITRTYSDDSTDRSNTYAYFSNARYEGLTHFAELYGNYKGEHTEWLAGIDYRNNRTRQDYYSFGPYGPYSSTIKDSLARIWQLSPYASLVVKTRKGFSFETGVRWNHHSAYGDNFTYTFNPFYFINHQWKFFINIYSSYKTPTLYQLFDAFAGNRELLAEKSKLVEGGIEYFGAKDFHTRLIYFNRNTKDAIQFLLTDPTFYTYQYKNINRQKNHGLEWEAAYKTGHWAFDVNYTYTAGKTISAYDETGSKLGKDTSYNNLYRIPKHVFNIAAGWQAGNKLFLRLLAKTVSKRLEPLYGSSPLTLASYYTVDLYGDYRLGKQWKIFLDLKNITNQRYFDVLGYNTRRFNFMTGLGFSL
ncbi:MAG: TonB-dependent receptor [Terrimonas sp.]|nr:TonB-dependent receptor [Terrimonas sp.]